MNFSYFSFVPQFSWPFLLPDGPVLPFPVQLDNDGNFPLRLQQTCLRQKSQPGGEMK